MEALLIAVTLVALDATRDLPIVWGILVAVAFLVVVYGLAVAWALRPPKASDGDAGR